MGSSGEGGLSLFIADRYPLFLSCGSKKG